MTNEQLELFIHGQGVKPVVVTASPKETLGEVLVRAGAMKEATTDILVFVGECQEALNEPVDAEDGSDQHGPVDLKSTLEALDLKRHRHVHCHRCRHVKVEVNFGGQTKRRSFSPATTVAVVTQWARKKFRLDPAAAAEYVLRLCKSTDQPRPDKHLGELAEAPKCSVCFDLVKEITPQG